MDKNGQKWTKMDICRVLRESIGGREETMKRPLANLTPPHLTPPHALGRFSPRIVSTTSAASSSARSGANASPRLDRLA